MFLDYNDLLNNLHVLHPKEKQRKQSSTKIKEKIENCSAAAKRYREGIHDRQRAHRGRGRQPGTEK